MVSFLEDFKELESYFVQRRFLECKTKINELEMKNAKFIRSSDIMKNYYWITKSNSIISDYLDMRKNENLSKESYQSLQKGFHQIMKEWIYKSVTVTDVDLILINNSLQFCCLCFIHNYEEDFRNIDNISAAIISLRKVLCLCNGINFKPPINFTIDKPAHEISILLKDILKSLKIIDPTCRLILVSNLILVLQFLLMADSSPSYKRWTEALKFVDFLTTDVVQFLDIKEEVSMSNCFTAWTIPKTRENISMEIDINADDLEESQNTETMLRNIPVFTFSIFGDADIYHYNNKSLLIERDTTYLLLLTTFITSSLFASYKDLKIPSFNDEDALSDCIIASAWRYVKGYLLFKNERLKEAREIMGKLNFSIFSSHFQTKKALLTASILSKDNNHELALSILNEEAMECEDCLPATLNMISEEHEFLDQKESQLKSLRLLFKLLRHKRQMETLKNCKSNIFFKTLDMIHTFPEVTMIKVLQKLASNLAHNELYEESAERYLDLLALLEETGPAKSIPHTIHNAAAVLLLIGDNGGVDRSKEAATLCRRAAEILSQNCDTLAENSLSLSFSDCGPTLTKRPRLEIHVGTVFMELESGLDIEGILVEDDSKKQTEEDENIFDAIHCLSVGVISSSLMSSGRDLTSFILLSECAFRENEFQSCMLLLSRCLNILNNEQSKERSKKNSREWFLETTNFIISYIWLRKAKILIKRESMENKDFGNDIKFCFINALKHNPDDAEIKYYYLKYMLASNKIETQNLMVLTPNLHFNDQTFSISPPKENLVSWYMFRPTTSKDQYEILIEEIGSSKK